jgi:hypothetical protein
MSDGRGRTEAPAGRTAETGSAELRDLRRSMLRRSIIDQASGLLAGRHGIGLRQARAMLGELAVQRRTDEADVAATVLGLAGSASEEPGVEVLDESAVQALRDVLPAADADPQWLRVRGAPRVRAAANARVIESFVEGRDGDEAARLLLDLLGQDAASVVIFAVRGRERAEMIGQHGFAPAETEGWRSVPLHLDTPLQQAYRTARPVFASSHQELVARFPALAGTAGRYPATAGVPVLQDGQVIGILAFGWSAPRDFPDRLRERLTGLAGRIGPALVRGAVPSAGGVPLEALLDVLALSREPWLVLADEDQAVPDLEHLRIVAADRRAPGASGLPGAPLLAVWPAAGTQAGLAAGLRGLQRHGLALDQRVAPGCAPAWAPDARRTQGAAAGRFLVLTWSTEVPEGP